MLKIPNNVKNKSFDIQLSIGRARIMEKKADILAFVSLFADL
jgi:hypothetical protein